MSASANFGRRGAIAWQKLTMTSLTHKLTLFPDHCPSGHRHRRPRFDAHELDVVVMELDDSSAAGGQGESFVLSVHGADQVGIVAAMTRVLADHGANITDLTTRLAGGLYLLVAEAQVPASVDGEALAAAVEAKATELGVEARWRAADTDLL
mgnify:CR=1 FL=1